MNYRFFLWAPVLFIFITDPLKSFTIKLQDFIESIYAKNQLLGKEYSQQITDILKKFTDKDGIININNTGRKKLWIKTFRIIQKYKKSSFKYVAAYKIHKTINNLLAQEKNIKPECPICLETIDNKKTKLTCSHVFCSPCLLQWFTQDSPDQPASHTNCPMCRFPISAETQNEFKKHPNYKNMLDENITKKDQADWALLAQEQQEINNDDEDSFTWEGFDDSDIF